MHSYNFTICVMFQYGFDNMKNGGLHTEVRSAPQSLRVICMPMCYILISTFAFLGKRKANNYSPSII